MSNIPLNHLELLGKWGPSANDALDRALDLLYAIQSALGTGETGDSLVAVARDAHRAELELANMITNRYGHPAREAESME